MKVRVKCSEDSCGWVHEDEIPDIPVFCPQCGGEVTRHSEPEQPDEVKSDDPERAIREADREE